MANKKISELPAISTFSGVEPLAVVQDGETRKATLTQVIALWTNYDGNDAPGTGLNVLAVGKSRIWNKIDTAQSFLVTRVASGYRLVELTAYA